MDIRINQTSSLPIYQQMYDQISTQILRGDIAQDTMLPSIRRVARELQVSVITVKRAYDELEQAGLLYTRPGKGCFVAPLQTEEREEAREQKVLRKLEKDLAYYRSLGLSKEDILQLIDEHF